MVGNFWSETFEKFCEITGGGSSGEGGDGVVRRPEDSDSEEPGNPLVVIWRKMSRDIDSLNFAQVVVFGTAVSASTWKVAWEVAKVNQTLVTKDFLANELKPIKNAQKETKETIETLQKTILYVGGFYLFFMPWLVVHLAVSVKGDNDSKSSWLTGLLTGVLKYCNIV